MINFDKILSKNTLLFQWFGEIKWHTVSRNLEKVWLWLTTLNFASNKLKSSCIWKQALTSDISLVSLCISALSGKFDKWSHYSCCAIDNQLKLYVLIINARKELWDDIQSRKFNFEFTTKLRPKFQIYFGLRTLWKKKEKKKNPLKIGERLHNILLEKYTYIHTYV